ncbi:MAG: CoA transferase [Candidatus Bathyarchaeia archaeon]|jgi:crotonobetainyl-CoA:carnitine CoA-transferase CaiB-like acyl-CoA transferase
MKPLDGLRVLDLTQAQAGPMCTMFLADMGADVIKIEPPWGEMTRRFPPLVNGVSPYYLYLNRGKRGITLNLKSEKGIEIFKKLVKLSDIVVENFSPGTMDKMGIGYDALSDINPKILFASISGFGQTGPHSQRLSFDPIAQASSGYMELTRIKIDPDGPPVYPPEAIADTIPALFCLVGVLSAIHHRDKTGVGQRIELAQVDSMISVMPSISFHIQAGITFSESLKKYALSVEEIYKAKDGYIVLTVPGEMQDRLAQMIGVEPHEVDSQKVRRWVEDKTVDEAVHLLEKARLPVSRVLGLDEVISDPQVRAREMIVRLEDPVVGEVRIPGFPVKFSETPTNVERTAPTLGEHNQEVLTTLLGLSPEKVKSLKEEGVL